MKKKKTEFAAPALKRTAGDFHTTCQAQTNKDMIENCPIFQRDNLSLPQLLSVARAIVVPTMELLLHLCVQLLPWSNM